MSFQHNLKSSIIVAIAGAALLLARTGTSIAQDGSGNGHNLLVNSDFNLGDNHLPTGWKVHTLPDCGFRFVEHKQAGESAELEMINDEQIESSLQQLVHVKPGWYSFSADIKTESVGSAGAPPQLFVSSASLPIRTWVHSMGFSDDWKKYQVSFRAGSKVPDVLVGVGLGSWGRPNTGKILIRDPVLVSSGPPSYLIKSSDLQVMENQDLEEMAESRYGVLFALRNEKPTAMHALDARWTVFAVYAALFAIALVGWFSVSPSRGGPPRD